MIAPIQTKQLSADGFTWNEYSPRVATITNELTHFQRVCYFAFDDWDSAHDFWESIVGKHCTRAQVRESERFTNHRWEVKTWGMPQVTLLKLIERDAARGGSLCDHRNRKPKSLPLPPIRRDWSLSASHSAIAYEAA